MPQGILVRDNPLKRKKTKSSSTKSKEEKKKQKNSKSLKKSPKSAKGDQSHGLASGNNNDSGNNEIDVNSLECSGDILAIAPETFCVEWIPGIGYSKACSSSDTEQRGGEVCNIVSMAWLRELTLNGQNVDIVLNHAGLCRADILQGAVTKQDVNDVLPDGYSVVIVEMTGADITAVLQQAAEAAYDGAPDAYPYGSGIRFKVDYGDRSKDNGFVYDIQVKPNFNGGAEDWQDIDLYTTYFVAANSMIVSGGEGYGAFVDVPGDKKTQLDFADADLFIHYIQRQCHRELNELTAKGILKKAKTNQITEGE